MSSQRWHTCAICGGSTRDAICGNRLLLHWDASRLPTEQPPAISWCCSIHQHYQMREATAVHANELGDLLFSLACGHDVQWVFRGVSGYTPALIAHELATRRLRLDQPQRCYACGALESEAKHATGY